MAEITPTCTYSHSDDRDAVLVAYLYEDIEPAERAVFEAHLAACVQCRGDIEALRDVRSTLGGWTPPERQSSVVSRQPSAFGQSTIDNRQSKMSTLWREAPVWAQAAAAVLVLGAAAGLANLDVRYDRDGLSVRTGWSKPAAGVAANPLPAPSAAEAPAPWRADLAALEQQLRAELRATPARTVPAVQGDAELLRRVRALIEESDKRHDRELALHLAQVRSDMNAQRQADLVKIDNSLGYVERNALGEAMKQRQLINYLVNSQTVKPTGR